MASGKARTILLVDDEALFRKSLAEGLERQEPSWRVLTAENGLVARAALEEDQVDLVLTDLAMPQSDGFELLSYMVEHRPWVPALILTAFGTNETRKRLKSLGFEGFLEKPVDFDALVKRISAILQPDASGFMRGISLPTFLQILELDGKSCKVRVSAGVRSGTLYIVDGVLHHAEAGPLLGEEAATDIVCWDGVELEVSALTEAPPRSVQTPLRELMLDSFRQRDERHSGRDQKVPRVADSVPRPASRGTRPIRGERTKNRRSTAEQVKDLAAIHGVASAGLHTPKGKSSGVLGTESSLTKEIGAQAPGQSTPAEMRELIVQPVPGSARRDNLPKEEVMVALESYLDEFKGVRGYIASGIMDFTGETLAVQSTDAGVNLEAVGAVFNDIFRNAHEASKKIGLDACNNLVITTPKGVIVMECSGASKTPHLHVIAILQEGGNQALAKMTIAKILPLVVKELS